MNHFSKWDYSLSDFNDFEVMELDDGYVIMCYFFDEDRPYHQRSIILEDALGVDIYFSSYEEADEHIERILEHLELHA